MFPLDNSIKIPPPPCDSICCWSGCDDFGPLVLWVWAIKYLFDFPGPVLISCQSILPAHVPTFSGWVTSSIHGGYGFTVVPGWGLNSMELFNVFH